MSNIIPFPSREVDVCDDDDDDIFDFPGSVPATPDPFPDFKILSVGYDRALMEAHVPVALADAMVERVKAFPECRRSFEIYERDEMTARIDGCVPLDVVEALLEMLAAA
jgi:hypothetical protein